MLNDKVERPLEEKREGSPGRSEGAPEGGEGRVCGNTLFRHHGGTKEDHQFRGGSSEVCSQFAERPLHKNP